MSDIFPGWRMPVHVLCSAFVCACACHACACVLGFLIPSLSGLGLHLPTCDQVGVVVWDS